MTIPEQMDEISSADRFSSGHSPFPVLNKMPSQKLIGWLSKNA
jgi:hypothetical protein